VSDDFDSLAYHHSGRLGGRAVEKRITRLAVAIREQRGDAGAMGLLALNQAIGLAGRLKQLNVEQPQPGQELERLDSLLRTQQELGAAIEGYAAALQAMTAGQRRRHQLACDGLRGAIDQSGISRFVPMLSRT
jgi:hypothetical protein